MEKGFKYVGFVRYGMKKSQLKILLSQLDEVEEKKPELEQYQTPAGIASEVLSQADVSGDLDGDVVDLGAGNGIFALGAAALGATVRGYDTDPDALAVAERNREWMENELDRELDVTFTEENVIFVEDDADTVIMNPPFGLQRDTEQSNVRFLETAFEMAPVVYALLHQSKGKRGKTRGFMRRLAEDHGYETSILAWFRFPLPRAYSFHEKDQDEINVDLYKFYRG